MSEDGGVLCEVKRPLSLWEYPHTVCLLDSYIPMFESPQGSQTVSLDPCLDCVNQTIHGQSESYNGRPLSLRPSAHASMLPSWLLRLILIAVPTAKRLVLHVIAPEGNSRYNRMPKLKVWSTTSLRRPTPEALECVRNRHGVRTARDRQ